MASRFWVGGTGTWDAVTTTHWAATTGGAGGQTVPGSADAVLFDAASGGGTVTVNTTVTVQSIACGAFTGTLDFSANNNNVTLSATMNAGGTGTRTLNLGNGTWTLTSTTNNATVWNIATKTNLTFNANSSTILVSANTTGLRNFNGGVLTYNILSIGANASGGAVAILGDNTFATFSMTAPSVIEFPSGATTTITNALSLAGSSSSQLFILSDIIGATATVAAAAGSTIQWAGLRDLTFTGSPVATNSFGLGHNTGITIAAPSSGGGLAPAPIVIGRGTPY